MADTETSVSNRLQEAAAALTGAAAGPDTARLLRFLGYDNADAGTAPEHARMLLAAATFSRLFRLPMPDAPGMVFFGAEADPACLGPQNAGLPVGGSAGSGLDPRRAFESCVGEGIEYLSQFAQPDDPLESGPLAAYAGMLDPGTIDFLEAVLWACRVPTDRVLDWIPVRQIPAQTPVRHIMDGTACWFPADLCLRRANPDFVAPLKLSVGCAAGPTPQDATLRAMLELIERDAVALWWRGGRHARPIAPNSEAGQAAATLLTEVRREQDDRRTSLLDITTDLGIPVVAAFSARPDGYGFALGLAARLTHSDAARSAIFEMCQSELSLHVIAAKQRESGHTALNENDLRQLGRAAVLDTRTCVLLRPVDQAAVTPAPLSGDPVEAIARLLAERNIVTYSLDLTRPRFGIPVVRVIAAELQSEPSEITTHRLALAMRETGGGMQHSGGIVLL